jgi:enterobactin synthetase component D
MSAPWRFDDTAAAAMPDRALPTVWPTHAGPLTLHVAAVTPPARFDTGAFARRGIDLPERIARAVPKRQAEYFAGRLCARAALAALGMPSVQVGTAALSAPAWPGGTTGSISHTGTLATAIALPHTACRGIGIDLETVPGTDGLEALRAVSLNAAERSLLAGAGGPGEDVLTTLVFSAKESFFKATAAAVGRYFDFTAIECVDVGADTLTCVVREALAPGLAPGLRCRFDVALAGRYVLTCFRW